MTERNGGRGIASLRRGGVSVASVRLQFESLEQRSLLSADPLTDIVAQPARFLSSGGGAALNTIVTGLTPAQIQQAYGAGSLTFSTSTGTIVGNGAGQTIAIVDAYDDPNIAADLHTFDQKFGLADPTFTKIEQYVNGVAPAANASWSTEISLDVEWAHAMAPGANILLVEANTSSLSNLLSSVQYAAAQSGVSVVSMSWGASEFSGETSLDSYFTTPAGHTPVAFVASAGDAGAGSLWPAASPNVLAVGGTSLNLATSGTYVSESAWSGSGGGQSLYESEPAAQSGVESSGHRDTPDVAFDANPSTGFAIYDSVQGAGQAGWIQVGGTSAGAPAWAGLIAIADQGLALKGQAAISNAPAAIYGLPSADFHDITTGSNGHAAGVGYDLVTGRGTPIASAIVSSLVGPAVTQSSSTTATASHTTASPMRFLASGSASFTLGGESSVADDVSEVAMTLASSGVPSLQGTSVTSPGAGSLNSAGSTAGTSANARSAAGAAAGSLFSDAAFDLAPDAIEAHPLGFGQNLSGPAAPGVLGLSGGQSLIVANLGDVGGEAGSRTSGKAATEISFDRSRTGRSTSGTQSQSGSAQREWLPLVDACFDESGWLAEVPGSVLATGDESSTADVALIAAAVALVSCAQVSKPANSERQISRFARRS